ncbi:hypothetical protein MRX96_022706 [Rhipicephalus microplus]
MEKRKRAGLAEQREAGERRRAKRPSRQAGGLGIRRSVVRVTFARLALSAPQARLGQKAFPATALRCFRSPHEDEEASQRAATLSSPQQPPRRSNATLGITSPTARIWAPGRDDVLPRTCGTC